MRRRLLSLCLMLCMVLGMLPVMATAAEAACLTVKAGEAEYEASCVDAGSVYAVQIPEVTAVTIGKTDAAAGDYTAANVSGGLLVSFQEYPLELTAEELSKCILTEEQKAGCTDADIDLSLGSWACILLSDGETQQYLFILLGDAGVMAIDGTEIPVADNVVDITDKTVYSRSSYYAKAVNIKVSGADVVSATEDGTTVNVILNCVTAADAEISVEFGTSLNKCGMSGHTGTVTLADGVGTLSLTLKGYYSSMESWNGTAAYTLNFSLDAPPTDVPARIKESGTVQAYTRVPVTIALKDYFSNAGSYYLVEGETLTPLDGAAYTFTAAETGTYTYTFAAANVVGTCPDYAAVTVTVTEIRSGTWIGYETSTGSMDYVLFTDANGDPIEGLTATVDGKEINVVLPQNFAVNGKVTAAFSLTQSGTYPFLSTKTGTAGTSSNKAVNNKFTEKTITLSNGAATFTFYYFNTAPTGSNQITWNLNYKIFNNIPAFVEGAVASEEKTMVAGLDTYTLDLSKLYEDKDGQSLIYYVSINDGSYIACDANYTFGTNMAGTYVLKFKASDGQDDSDDIYTATLTMENSDETFTVPVSVIQSVEGLTFYADSLSGETLTYEEGSIQVPVNVKAVWWKTADGRNGTAAVSEGTSITLQETTFVVKTALGDVDTGATITVTDPDGNTITGSGYTYLLDSGSGYTFKAAPGSSYNSGWAANTMTEQNVTTEFSATVEITLAVKSPKTITVDKGAEVHVYYQSTNYVMTEILAVYSTDNGDTVTYVYSCPNKYGNTVGYMYFAEKGNLIDKAGYLHSVNDVTLSWADDERAGGYRGDYDRSTTFGARAYDSMLINANNRGHVVLGSGQTFRLRSWRMWAIIDSDTTNVMIEPEFTYTRYGDNVIELNTVANCGTGGNNWVDMTASGSGVAFLEVGYEAVHVVNGYEAGEWGGAYGQPSNFTYNAIDPARKGFVVVQTDGNNASDVTFGITNNKGSAWDADFDTFYFTGDYGQLTFTPTATSGITGVAVSNNKGESFSSLTADENGAYTAPIVSGANVIRITNGNGQTAYQVVRGNQITYTITNATEGKASDAAIVPGDTVEIAIAGWVPPQGKMAGIYNASGNQLGYKCSWDGTGKTAYTAGTYSLNVKTFTITLPEEAADTYILTNGKIGYSYYGSPAGDHRNVTDAGKGQNTTANTVSGIYSVLPDIVIPVEVHEYTVTLTGGEGYTITAVEDSASPVKQGGSFSFTVTVNDGYEGTPVVKAGETQLTGVEGVYTIENITADQTVTVTGIEKAAIAPGNLNGDAAVDAADAALAYSVANGNQEMTGEQLAAADVNGDGKVNAADAALIYAYANGKITSFPANNN